MSEEENTTTSGMKFSVNHDESGEPISVTLTNSVGHQFTISENELSEIYEFVFENDDD